MDRGLRPLENQACGVIERRGRPFMVCMAFALPCRAGDFARRKLCGIAPARVVCCLFCFVGRGLDPAAHYFLKFQCRAGTGNQPGTPRGVHPCREAYMPPLQIRVPRTRAKNIAIGRTSAGRIHAAPTNLTETAGKWARQAFAADVHGGVKTPPYKPPGNGRQMGKASCRPQPSTAGGNRRFPRRRALSHPTPAAACRRAKCRFWG